MSFLKEIRVAVKAAKKNDLAVKEEVVWQDLLGYFRCVNGEKNQKDFTDKARVLFTSPRFDNQVRDVFRKAIKTFPDKFHWSAIRDYLNRHDDKEVALFYMDNFLSISGSDLNLERESPEASAVRAAVSVVASAVDMAMEGEEEKATKELMKEFCILVLDRFPNFHDSLDILLKAVSKRGVVYLPKEKALEKKPSIPSIEEGIAEKGDWMKSSYRSQPKHPKQPVQPIKLKTVEGSLQESLKKLLIGIGTASAA